jgi:hypothetical protein
VTDTLTREQAAIIGAYTGVLCGPFQDLHAYIEKLMDRPVWTHEMGEAEFMDVVKERARPDFLGLVPFDDRRMEAEIDRLRKEQT